MMRCPPLYDRVKSKEKKKRKRGKRVATIKEEKVNRWAIDNKED